MLGDTTGLENELRFWPLILGLWLVMNYLPAAADEVSLQVPEGRLAGTLLVPDGDGPWPVVLILSGSGQVDRDGNLLRIPGQNNSLRQLAEALAENGVASLRIDKRGIGGSESAAVPENKKRFGQFIDDAVLWTTMLQVDSRFSSVSIVGHDQGAQVGMNAAWIAAADGFVSLAGPGLPLLEILREQFKESLPIRSRVKAESVIAALESGKTVPEPPTEMTIFFRPSLQEFLISWHRYDPYRDLGRLSCPVSIIQGLNDLQVDRTSAEFLQEAKPEAALVLIPGVNHIFKMVLGDNPVVHQTTLTNPDLQFSPEAIAAVLTLTEAAEVFHKVWQKALDRLAAHNSRGWLLPNESYDSEPIPLAIGRWAVFQEKESAGYRFGLADGGYVSEGSLILDEHHDCVSLMYRCTELARARDYRGNLSWALRTRFAGADPNSVVDEDGRVDYDRPEHLDFSLDMIRSGIWGRDISSEVGGTVVDSKGTSRYPPGSFAWVPTDSLVGEKLQSGDIIWFVLNPDHEKALKLRQDYGLAIGHIGLMAINPESGALELYHAASKDLPGQYQGSQVVSVDLATYLERVERYGGVMVSRLE